MENFAEGKCEACRKGSPKITDAQIKKLKPLIPDWEILETGEFPILRRVFHFKNFDAAMNFSVSVGLIAQSEGHHPALLTEWGRVTVTWYTHVIKGLHRNDFIMAAKTDRIYRDFI